MKIFENQILFRFNNNTDSIIIDWTKMCQQQNEKWDALLIKQKTNAVL